MKKIILLMALLSTTILADWNDQNDILENRIENTLNYKFRVLNSGNKTLRVNEYDVDVFDNYVNVKAEVSYNPNNFDFVRAFAPIKKEISKNLGNNPQINVVVEYDKVIGEDEIIFNGDI